MTTTQDMDPELSLLLRMREFFSQPGNRCSGVYLDGPKRCLIGFYLEEVNDLHGNGPRFMAHVKDGLALLGFKFNQSKEAFNLNDYGTDAEILERIDTAIAARTAELAEKETA